MNYISQTNFKFKDLIAKFNLIKTDALSGNLIIQIANFPSWMLYFSNGKLAGISGGIDPIDRWKRNLALASLNLPVDRLIKSHDRQEAFLNANKIAQAYVGQEVLFDTIQLSQMGGDRLSYRFMAVDDKNTQVQSVVPQLEIQPLLTATIQLWQEWEKQGLAIYPPSYFPVVQKRSQITGLNNDKDLEYMLTSIDGERSLRALAIRHQQKLIDFTQSLLPLIETGIIYLSPVKQSSLVMANGSNSKTEIPGDRSIQKFLQTASLPDPNPPKLKPLIACIDDSIAVYKNLEKILAEQGYRSYGVQDPLKIMTSLIKNKPDLIFLDLVMPVTNGYEVCDRIRKTPSLANIPIIILTGNDGLIDRVRTKFVGATGFIGKPIAPESILKIIDKYVENKPTNRKLDSPSLRDAPRTERLCQRSEETDLVVDAEQVVQDRQLQVLNDLGKRVLVVDDDRNIREVVSMCLHKLKGWDVLTAASGQEGLNGVDLNNPDVIILDVMMPEMDGLAFLRQLRSNPDTQRIPVILLTANRYLPDKELLTELGVVETISKPFLPVNLVRQIDKALLN